jgi:hypothetical protein
MDAAAERFDVQHGKHVAGHDEDFVERLGEAVKR